MAPLHQNCPSISSGMILFLSANDKQNYCGPRWKIEAGKFEHMVVVLHVGSDNLYAIVCLITSKAKLWFHEHYRIITTGSDSKKSYFSRKLYQNTYVHVIAGTPFTKTSYIKIGEPFLVGRGDLGSLQRGRAKAFLKLDGLRCLREDVEEITPLYRNELNVPYRNMIRGESKRIPPKKRLQDGPPLLISIIAGIISIILMLFMWFISLHCFKFGWSTSTVQSASESMMQTLIAALEITSSIVLSCVRTIFFIFLGFLWLIFGILVPRLWQGAGMVMGNLTQVAQE